MNDEDEPVVKDDVEAACWSEAYAAILSDPQNNYEDYDDLVADAKEQADIAVTLLRTRRERGTQNASAHTHKPLRHEQALRGISAGEWTGIRWQTHGGFTEPSVLSALLVEFFADMDERRAARCQS